jgi:RNA polymerase sigma factor (sigma-70 family)
MQRGNLTGSATRERRANGLREIADESQGDPKLETVERISEEGKLRVEELYAAHAQSAVRLAYLLVGNQEIARDIAQDAFLRAFGRFADLRKPNSFPFYLRATIVNLARKHFRRRGLERLYVERLRGRPAQNVSPPNVEQREVVAKALLKVPERQRAALVLHYYEDLSEYQVADLLGVSEQAARSLVARGRRTLREQLGGMRP